MIRFGERASGWGTTFRKPRSGVPILATLYTEQEPGTMRKRELQIKGKRGKYQYDYFFAS